MPVLCVPVCVCVCLCAPVCVYRCVCTSVCVCVCGGGGVRHGEEGRGTNEGWYLKLKCPKYVLQIHIPYMFIIIFSDYCNFFHFYSYTGDADSWIVINFKKSLPSGTTWHFWKSLPLYQIILRVGFFPVNKRPAD